MERETCDWTGKSGIVYTYEVFKLPKLFESNQRGNYIYSRLEGKVHRPIYIGEGNLREVLGERHHKTKCISNRKATHLHIHFNLYRVERSSEEFDLLEGYPDSLEPIGCNARRP